MFNSQTGKQTPGNSHNRNISILSKAGAVQEVRN
jgi:hypothetical protein